MLSLEAQLSKQKRKLEREKRRDNEEEWRPVNGFEGIFEASDFGRVRRLPSPDVGTPTKPRVLRPPKNKKTGYRQVRLSVKGNWTEKTVHRLVAYAFLGYPPLGKDNVNHKDSVKTNNYPSNLEWVTHRENMEYNALHSTSSQCKHSKLTDDQVSRIAYEVEDRFHTEVAKDYGISRQTVSNIALGKSWSHVTGIHKGDGCNFNGGEVFSFVLTKQPDKEVWAPVPGYEDLYQASSEGRVKRLGSSEFRKPKKDRVLKAAVLRGGYLGLSLSQNGQVKKGLVHRIVASAFLGYGWSDTYQVNHVNGDKTDNRVSNLQWVTFKQNIAHSMNMGFHRRGCQSKNAKLTEDEVKRIAWEADRKTYASVAAAYGVTSQTVSNIRSGKSWGNVTGR